MQEFFLANIKLKVEGLFIGLNIGCFSNELVTSQKLLTGFFTERKAVFFFACPHFSFPCVYQFF